LGNGFITSIQILEYQTSKPNKTGKKSSLLYILYYLSNSECSHLQMPHDIICVLIE